MLAVCPAIGSKSDLHGCCLVLPPQDFVKVNFDAHIYDGGEFCCGIVIWDWRGSVLVASAKR